MLGLGNLIGEGDPFEAAWRSRLASVRCAFGLGWLSVPAPLQAKIPGTQCDGGARAERFEVSRLVNALRRAMAPARPLRTEVPSRPS